ncbi:hypothetical protein DFP72DRAFT_212985 [Ephemerocybe angulata]|uniref:Uncharacterized protein n=1 Tax=Ephemerocybe angulata TaxID=980116 RepID=A0A8H6I574_9AGAR|nr:hypothetical protein DFP72DRAFT_212985 [Tulosesus angulatus]
MHGFHHYAKSMGGPRRKRGWRARVRRAEMLRGYECRKVETTSRNAGSQSRPPSTGRQIGVRPQRLHGMKGWATTAGVAGVRETYAGSYVFAMGCGRRNSELVFLQRPIVVDDDGKNRHLRPPPFIPAPTTMLDIPNSSKPPQPTPTWTTQAMARSNDDGCNRTFNVHPRWPFPALPKNPQAVLTPTRTRRATSRGQTTPASTSEMS